MFYIASSKKKKVDSCLFCISNKTPSGPKLPNRWLGVEPAKIFPQNDKPKVRTPLKTVLQK